MLVMVKNPSPPLSFAELDQQCFLFSSSVFAPLSVFSSSFHMLILTVGGLLRGWYAVPWRSRDVVCSRDSWMFRSICTALVITT
uniref:Uncharacterized protein n=1 Tax=Physcomitrium patens TaxID=3218 RepID=A0A2K1IXQ6_PHYPA|nr:hypothetical protein PHYPA_023873 [Physcomitrium patens]